MKDKRGVSPVIATVLLVSMAVVLGGIIFMWARGFIGEQTQKNGVLIEKACKDVVLELDYNKVGISIEMIAHNRGNYPIHDLSIEFQKGGDSSVSNFKFDSIDVGMSSAKKTIPLGGATKIIVYPVILGSVGGDTLNTKEFICRDSPNVINL